MARAKKKHVQPPTSIVSSHHARAIGLGFGLVFIIGLTSWLGAYTQRIFPGLRIGEVPVGSLTRVEAIERLETRLAESRVSLTYGQSNWEPTYAELGVVFDLVPPVSRAYSLGRWAPMEDWARSWILGQALPLNYTWKTDSLEVYLAKVIEQIGQAPQVPEISYANSGFQVSEAASGLVLDIEKFQADLRPAVLNGQSTSLTLRPEIKWPAVAAADYAEAITQAERLLSEPLELRNGQPVMALPAEQIAHWFNFTVRPEGRVDLEADVSAIGAYLLTIAKDLNREPRTKEVVASLHRVEEIRAGTPGQVLAISEAVKRIETALLSSDTSTVELPMDEIQPNTSYAAIPPPRSRRVKSLRLT